MDYDPEPFICDECGRTYRNRGGCPSCRQDYAQGKADADAYHDALLIGGEDLAARMELEAEFGYLG